MPQPTGILLVTHHYGNTTAVTLGGIVDGGETDVLKKSSKKGWNWLGGGAAAWW